MTPSTRLSGIDCVRLFALVGICVVNVPSMAQPLESLFLPMGTQADRSATFFVQWLFQMKFFLLFSFVFGWGIEIQRRSAERRGVPYAPLYWRRQLGLFLLGCVHAILVFSGDILVIYALAGALIWPLRDRSPADLLRFSIIMVPVSMATLAVCGILIGFVSSLPIEPSTSAGLGGNFLEATLARLLDWPWTLIFLLMFQLPLVLSAFALGLAAAKSDFLAPHSTGRQKLTRMLPALLAIGLVLNLGYALAFGGLLPAELADFALLGIVGLAIGAPALSSSYLWAILMVGDRWRVPEFFLRAGRNSLSTYVLQGVLAGLVFGGHGLGLYKTFGGFALFWLSLGIAFLSIACVSLYVRFFGRGPLEVVLRRIVSPRRASLGANA